MFRARSDAGARSNERYRRFNPPEPGCISVSALTSILLRSIIFAHMIDQHELGAEHDGKRDAWAGTSAGGALATRSPTRELRGTMRKDTEVHSGYYTEVPSALQPGSVR